MVKKHFRINMGPQIIAYFILFAVLGWTFTIWVLYSNLYNLQWKQTGS